MRFKLLSKNAWKDYNKLAWVVRYEHQKQLVEFEKQLREKVSDRDKIPEINSLIFQIT